MEKLYRERFYRNCIAPAGFSEAAPFEVKIRESDLLVFAEVPQAPFDLEGLAYRTLAQARSELERYIERDGEFARTLVPHSVPDSAPPIVREMARGAARWGVGPMAAVAGAIAERVGRALLAESRAVVVENGGDIFLALPRSATCKLYAGEESPFTDRILFEVGPSPGGLGVCTSSARVGPSLSLGYADAVVAVARSAACADAAATAIANRVQFPDDVAMVVEQASNEDGLKGLIVAAGDKIGFWGNVRIVKREK